ncbi:MBL fold metallo-hydrolase [Pedobacter aquatilis]|uniref:MBL fold metallo-hydrolase n=1 Tax=Pedobacter aquatilis TaxID=351343 RepID=UPI0025B4CABB|nr:MBL fold metallo-hydrolase [Pedobacter aquatilis]MDN3585371.1 MBL fold metallo-hydrolase [Pedobacter aquatilis]
MALYFSSLNSGSNGNCYYIGNENEAVLIDVGISCKELEKRMYRCGLDIQKVKAIFISHEHSDHIKGLLVFSKKYNLPVYITRNTLINSRLALDSNNVISFSHLETIKIGGLKILGFSKHHDAADPFSFTIEYNNTKVGVFTDIGTVCDRLITQFRNCNAAFLEANYDIEMLENGSYPYYLKKRIRGGKGHLSNTEALDLFVKHKPDYMSHLLLSHLSKDNNCPDLVEKLFKAVADKTFIAVASRYQESEIYFTANPINLETEYSFNPLLHQPAQLNLF